MGVEQVLGKPPEYVCSYTGFWANDRLYMNWLNNTNGHNIPYHNLTETFPPNVNPVDLVVATPPCAALSMLNTGKSAEVKGAGCAKNDWMYLTAQHAIEELKAKVIITENAPNLYTAKGEDVRKKLIQIAHDRGYSVTFYKTNSILHGLPQKRERTFCFMWNTKTAPILDWVRVTPPSFAEWVAKVPKDAKYQDIQANARITQEPVYRFFKHKFGDVRATIMSSGKDTPIGVLERDKLLDEFLAWARAEDDEKAIKRGEFIKAKFDKNMGIWDNSARFFKEAMNACVSRNLFDTMHPTEERSLTVREVFHMMNLPHNFVYPDEVEVLTNINYASQNVPVITATKMVQQAVKFINGELEDSGQKLMMQNNCSMRFDTKPTEEYNTLSEFL
jgi:site-specific DNA-cytosine methylase